MKPILFEKNAQDFKTQGIGTLSDLIAGTVTEELNGVYEAELTYPISGRYFQEIQQDRIVLLPHNDSGDLQAFRIYKISKPINGIATISLEHISYELNKMTLHPFTANSCGDFFNQLGSNIIDPPYNYTFSTDISLQGDFSVAVPKTVRSALGGERGSALDVCGYGEFEFDNRNVSFKKHRGVDSGVSIRYGKNLTDLTYEIDATDEITGIVPYYTTTEQTTSEDSSGDTKTESRNVLKTIDGYIVTRKGTDKSKVVPVDLSSNFDHEPTEDELKTAAATYLASNGKSAQSITVSFIALWQTEEYKNVASLQRLALGDTASVSYDDLGVDVKAEIIKTTFNVLTGRYDSMELGNISSNISQTISQNARNEAQKAFNDFADEYTAFITEQTDKLAGGIGGHIVINRDADGKPTEILAMDTDKKNTATYVVRLNKNGIGFSKHGYNGPYETAWTIDGKFSANYIITGILRANLVKAGILSDTKGLNSWNMETGELHINTLSNLNASNLIQGTLDGWTWNGGVSADQWEKSNPACPETNGRGFMLPTNSDGSWRYSVSKGFVLKNGMNYTLSYCNTAYNCDALLTIRTNESDRNQWTTTVYETSSNSGAWVKHVINFKCTKTGTYYCIIGNKQISGLSAGNMALQGLKLEQGNLVTGWTPHPEDLEAHVAITRSKDGSAALVAEAPNLYFNASDRITVNAGSKILYKDVDSIKFMTPRASNPSENYERGLTQFVKDVMDNPNESTYIAGQNLRLYSQGGISSFYVDDIYISTSYDSPRNYVSLKSYIKGVMNGTY